MSAAKARAAVIAILVGSLLLLSWLPAPLPGRGAPRVPATVQLEVRVSPSAVMPAGGAVRSLNGFRTHRPAKTRPAVACASIRFTAVGIAWTQRGTAAVSGTISVGPEADRLGPGTEVESALEEGPDPGSPEYHPERRATDLLWVGNQARARCSRFRLTVPGGTEISDLRVVFLNTSGTASGGEPTLDVPQATGAVPGLFGAEPAEAIAWRPGIVTRAQWGADEALRNCEPDYAPSVHVAFVHHTANSNAYGWSEADDLVRSIYRYHTNALGWCDIAYNFLVDRYGRIFEGRAGGMDEPVIPAATLGFNTGSTSVAAIGHFEYSYPPEVMVKSIQKLLAWRLDVAHVPAMARVWRRSGGSTGGKYPAGTWVRFPVIAAHRDAGFTGCPGDYLYARLPGIRKAVSERGLPKIFGPWQSTERLIPTQGTVTWSALGSTELTWTLRLFDPGGVLLRTWTGQGEHFSATWDGAMLDAVPAAPGEYTVKLLGRSGGVKARAAEFTLQVDPIPEPTPSPSETPIPEPSPTTSEPSPTPTEGG